MPVNLLQSKQPVAEGIERQAPVNLLASKKPLYSWEQAPPAIVWDKLEGMFRDPKMEQAKATNIYAISEATGLSLKETADNYEWLKQSSKITGMTPRMENQAYTAMVLTPFILAGLAAHPVGTAAGLIGFGLLNKLIPTDKWLNDFEKANDFEIRKDVRTTIELVDFMAKAWVVGGILKKGPQAFENFAKKKIIEYKLPRTVKLSPAQVRDIYQTGKLTTAEQKLLYAELNLSGKQLKTAVSKGVGIEIPAEKIVRIVHKPWYAKIKQMFMAIAQDQVVIDRAAKVRQEPAGLITQQKAKPYWERTRAELLQKEPPITMPPPGKAPTKAPVAPIEGKLGVLTEENIAPVVEKLGGKVKSITDEKNSIYEGDRTVYIDDAKGSTKTLPLSKITEQAIADKLGVKLEEPVTVEQPTVGKVGDKGVLSTNAHVDFQERRTITSKMPFTLLGNKAEVISRITAPLKETIQAGIKKVYDLWGGAKGYRIGLFNKVKPENYHLNEFSDERSNYYKNVQDPVKHKQIIKHVEELKIGLVETIAKAFDIDPGKYPPDYLKAALNKWLGEGMSDQRYQYVRDIVQAYGDQILKEAQKDKFASPESSAKYYFLENTAIFGLKQDAKGYFWTQGIIRKSRGKAALKEAIRRLEEAPDIIGEEHARDKGMKLTKDDAWKQMDIITKDIKAGKINPKETVVLVDPQYLNPSAEEGTYSVGRADTTWPGHKKNLETHLLPLIETGAKVIYTNNADPNLLKWLDEHKLPYNIETKIGAVANRAGRDEVISFINYDIEMPYDTTRAYGPEGDSIFNASESFKKWLDANEGKFTGKGIPAGSTKALVQGLKEKAADKGLSIATMTKFKRFLSIPNIRKATPEEIGKLINFVEDLEPGDAFISPKQHQALAEVFKEMSVPEVTPKRVLIDKFGQKEDMLSKGIVGKIPNEMIPTVDIKEGQPLIAKVVNNANELMTKAENEVLRRDKQFGEMLTKAEKSRKRPIKERLFGINKEIFKALSGKQVTLTREERAVVAYLKNFFKKVRKDLKMEKYRKNYVTHLEKTLLEKIATKGIKKAIKDIFKPEKQLDIPINLMLELDNIIGSEKFFKFALERKGGVDPTMNLRKIVHVYSNLYETKMALDKILPEGQAITQLLLKGRSAKWLKKFLQNMKGRGLDQDFRTGKMAWLAKATDFIISVGYLKLLALNWKSGAKNLIAGETNTWIWQDFGKYMVGKQRFINNPKKAIELASQYGILDGLFYEYAQKGIGKLRAVSDLAMILQKAGEYEIRASLFAGELTEAEWKAGKITQAHAQEISDIVAITQGKFNKIESPLFLQTWYGRMFAQMNRWRITNAMLLRRIVTGAQKEYAKGNYKGPYGKKLSKAFLAYGIGMYIAYEFAKAGLQDAERIARSMAETINNTVEIVTLEPIVRSVTNNPTFSVLKELAFSIQNLANTIAPAMFEEPRKLEFRRGIEETHITPVRTVEDLLDLIE